jgi:hypothetical protein
MTKGTIICYTLGPKATQIQRNKLRKLLLGYKDISNNSQYNYFRDGLLTRIPSVGLVRSVFIVKKEDAGKVKLLLDEFCATVYVREVTLTQDDCKALGIAFNED